LQKQAVRIFKSMMLFQYFSVETLSKTFFLNISKL